MEKLIGLIIFLSIFIISKILENAQKKQPVQKNKPEPVNDKTDYTKTKTKPAPVYSHTEKVTAQTGEYHAPKDEIEDFLKSIGVIKEEKTVRKPQAQSQSQKLSFAKKKTALPTPKPIRKLDEPVNVKLGKIENDYKQIETESRFDLSLLGTKDNLRNAFILSEILKPPLALRRFNDR